jgi:hypothetical protein
MLKKTLIGLALAAAATVSAFAAYPEKTVTMIVPFPPGLLSTIQVPPSSSAPRPTATRCSCPRSARS